jgi:hypothetical protein
VQQHEPAKSPLDIIAAGTMKPPASKRSKTVSKTAVAAAVATSTAARSQAHVSNGCAGSGVTTAAAAAAAGSDASADKQPAPPPPQQQRQPPHARTSHQQQQQRPQSPQARIVPAQRQIKALSRVSFKAGNWLELPCPSNKYEVITCFSVTKWIQLNWGDDGIMQLFHKFYRWVQCCRVVTIPERVGVPVGVLACCSSCACHPNSKRTIRTVLNFK